MRGGALFQLAWGSVLAVFGIGCWVWTGDALQTGSFAFAVAMTWGGAMLVVSRSRREALRTGEPRPTGASQTVPSSSLGAVLAAIGFASILFGFTFGRFLIFFGGGLLVVALGMVVIERRGERNAAQGLADRVGDREKTRA